MSALEGYQIPIIGMDQGAHSYSFEVTDTFFRHFEKEELIGNRFETRIDLDRQNDMFVLQIEINGKLGTQCDRCMADISLPISGSHSLIIKLKDGESDDPEVEYISPEATHLDVDGWIYEYLLMSLPLVNVYDCESDDPIPCDDDALDKLEEGTEKPESGIWDALKNLDVDN